ncbi:MAG: hypothetical protein WD468_12680 [Pirellulales bacterium]
MNRESTSLSRALVIYLLFAAAPFATAAEWGSIKGRFVVDGAPSTLPPLTIDKDEFCIANASRKDDKVLIGKDNALVNAVVYLFLGRGGKIEIHPDYADALKTPVEFNNKMCAFHPRVAAVRIGQPFVIKNSDPVGHNTNAISLFNETIAAGESRTKTFDKAVILPMPVSCGMHPFMRGQLLIQDHPYMAVSGEDGTFEIKNIPVGKHVFMFWHETGYLNGVKVGAGNSVSRGKATLNIEPGKTLDLGDIKVPVSLLKR